MLEVGEGGPVIDVASRNEYLGVYKLLSLSFTRLVYIRILRVSRG